MKCLKERTLLRYEGFTLIEILMVISIIAILSVVAIPQFIDYGDDAKSAVTRKRLFEIKKSIVGDPDLVSNGQYTNIGFKGHLGQNPRNLNDLVNRGTYPTYDPFNKVGWRGPYLNTQEADWNKDGWGTDLQYTQDPGKIVSCGPNLTCGDSDDITVEL